MRGEMSTPMLSAVSARPRRGWAIQMTYEPFSNVWLP